MDGDEGIPAWIGDRLSPAWPASNDGGEWLDKGSGRAWLISEQGREWIETPDGMAWFCSREGEWWTRNRPSWATREEVLRISSLPQAAVASPDTALRAKLSSLSGSNAVVVRWLPERRFLVGRDAIRVYGRVGLIVLDDQQAGPAGDSAEQVIEAIRADKWLNDWVSARTRPLVLPRQWPNLIETWIGVERFTIDTSAPGGATGSS